MTATEFPDSRHRRALPADVAMAAVILLLGLFLAGAGSSIVQRWRASSARHQSLGFEDQLGIAANTAGLIVIVWWALSFAIAVVAALLERSGRPCAASAAGKFSPAFMRRLALAAVGLQLLTAPLATASTAPAFPATESATPAASAGWTPTAVPASTGTPPPASTPAASAPQPGTPADAPAAAGPQWRPLSPIVEPGLLAARPSRPPEPAGHGTEVTVRPGDSLWSLSAARLGSFASDVDIALEWPRLYHANRDIIGANPHFLRPGEVLKLPPGH